VGSPSAGGQIGHFLRAMVGNARSQSVAESPRMSENTAKSEPEQRVAVYEPDLRRKTGFLRSLVEMSRNIWISRELVWQLFRRDFLAVHRKAFLGVAWIVISPIVGILSWIFMNSAGVLKPGDVGIPYPAYVLLGTTFWGLFMSFYSMAADTLRAGQSFIMQVKYPHEALLAKQVLQSLASFFFSLVVMAVGLLLFGVVPNWRIVFLPVLIIPMLLLGTAIGLFVSTVGVVATEVRKFADLAVGLLIFFTPIIYSRTAAGEAYATLVRWNPLTYIVGGVRDIVAYGRLDRPDAFLLSALASFVVFLVSWRMFYVLEEKIIEKMI